MKYELKNIDEFLLCASTITDNEHKLYLNMEKYQFIIDFFTTSINNLDEIQEDSFENIMQALKIVDRQSYNFLRGKLMDKENLTTRRCNMRPTPVVKAKLIVDSKEYDLLIKKQDLRVYGDLSNLGLKEPVSLPQLYYYIKSNNVTNVSLDEITPLYEELLDNLKIRDILLKVIVLNTKDKFKNEIDTNNFFRTFKTNIVNMDKKIETMDSNYFNSKINKPLLAHKIKVKTIGNCN